MNRKAGAQPFFSELLPDAPWPVMERRLLSDREQSLYQKLLNLYPHQKILVQVALSQLIEVDRSHRDWRSIRGRYKQLVADFVLCRPDLSIVAVIELDDRSHESAVRQGADVRKNKALADAGIRLVRIPAGDLPSENALRGLIDASGAVGRVSPEEFELRLAQDTYAVNDPFSRGDDSGANSRQLKRIALKAMVGAFVLFGGWFLYSQFLPRVVQRVLQPLAVPHVVTPSVTGQTAVTTSPAAAVAPSTRHPNLPDAKVLQQQKDRAWAAFYSAPASCEDPVDWNAQVECGNQYMRAKKRFEAQWATENAPDRATVAVGVPDRMRREP